MREKKRSPVLAAFLSSIIPGLGQCYNGQLFKGIILFLASLVLPLALALTGLQFRLPGLIAILVLGVIYWLAIIVEAFITALKKKVIILKPYNRWFVYLGLIIVVGILEIALFPFLMTQAFGLKTFQIASGSMEPTLLVGDYILVNPRFYDSVAPQKGNLVMVENPRDPSMMLVKRVIAEGGEKVEIQNKQVYVNNTPIEEQYKVHNDRHVFLKEDSPEDSLRDNFGPVIVPSGHLFVLGDNRDNSMDSRHWGSLPENRIKGKPWLIYFSYKEDTRASLKRGLGERLKRLFKIVFKARWERILRAV